MVRRIDVAKRAGVSPSAVSRLINENGYVAAEVRERVNKAIKELNYIPNKMAQSLRMEQCRQIACVIPSSSNPFYHDVVMEIEETALDHGYTFSLYNMTSERQEYLKLVLEGFYDALIFPSPFEVSTFFNIEEIVSEIPICLYCYRQIDYVVRHVYVDLRKAMKRNVDWLIETGYRNILFLGQELDIESKMTSPRYEGYIVSLREHDMSTSPHLTHFVPNLKDTLIVGYERVKSLIAV